MQPYEDKIVDVPLKQLYSRRTAINNVQILAGVLLTQLCQLLCNLVK
jgi:hypothetical protein